MTVTLNGEVVADDWKWLYDYLGIPGIFPCVVRDAIANIPEGEELTLEINSVGGSVFAGFEIYSMLREAKCRTVALVQSLAASAASTIMVGCSKVVMSPVAQVMIHLPQVSSGGNQDDLKRDARMLESITQSILNGYELKCGGKTPRADLERRMHEEAWIPAQEAVEMGLADSIDGVEEGDLSLVFSSTVVNSVGNGIRALANSAPAPVSVQDLLAKYEQAVRAGAAPAEGHPVSGIGAEPKAGDPPASISDNWQAKARLEIESNRFKNL